MDQTLPASPAVHADAAADVDARAFNSPFRTLLGLRIVEWDAGRCVAEIPVQPQLTNLTGAVAGAVVAGAIDMAGALAGCFTPVPAAPRRAVTLTIAVAFIGTVTGGTIRATAVKLGGGKRIFTSTVTVASESGEVIATGQGTFRYIP